MLHRTHTLEVWCQEDSGVHYSAAQREEQGAKPTARFKAI